MRKFFKRAKEYVKQRARRAQLMSMPLAVIAFVVTIIAAAISAKILGKMQASENSTSLVYEILGFGLDAIKELVGWTPMIAMVIAGIIILTLLVKGMLPFAQTLLRRGE